MSRPVDRRVFSRQLTLALGGVALAGAGGGAKAGGEEPEKTDPTREAAKPPSEVDLLLTLVQLRYPDARWDATAISEVRAEIERNVARTRALSRFPLKNGDAPASPFRAFLEG